VTGSTAIEDNGDELGAAGCVSKVIEASRPSDQMEAVGRWVFEVVGGRKKNV